ncbi:GNAT family N-acetyltransferase [Clostridium sp. C8-1-8]|uniref:GNAT family N-acetyltransferase n=1 Tax=Clostridium sp. C8-1-8 TaxID=2698831 RepID=UPI00136B6BDE|nr:GNAT family N-acetyltransferase [Clostridium sp. C8-1-8]
MLLDEKIKRCELEYIKAFCAMDEKKDVIRVRDDSLKDMYYHNYTYLKKDIPTYELRLIIDEEIIYRKEERSNFCNFIIDSTIDSSLEEILDIRPSVSRNGYYLFDKTYFDTLKSLRDCTIKKVTNEQLIEDSLFCDLQQDVEAVGKDFCERRAYRRGKIYVTDKGVDSYNCYYDGTIVGKCDMFIYDGIAKIEDFGVIPKYQRKGYGTTILKHLINIAMEAQCHTIYLVADEEDTPKDMYLRIGFTKVGDRTDLLFRF